MISPDIKTPKYGESILSRFTDDITKYDYRDRTGEKNPLGNQGIHLIHYDGRYNAKINYLDKGVIFLIEDDYYKYLNNQIFYENLTSSHYEYFSHYLTTLKEDIKRNWKLSSEFRNDLPMEWKRREKINQLI